MNLPYALRELALAHSGVEHWGKAEKYAVKSLQVAEQQGAKQQFAKSLLVCGQIGAKLGKPNAPQQIEEAERRLAEFETRIDQANRDALEYLGLVSVREED